MSDVMEKPHIFDLSKQSLRELNQALHDLRPNTNATLWHIKDPRGLHSLAVGVNAPITVEIGGNVGYYCGGMNQQAKIVVDGMAGVGVAENMMSGFVHIKGDASQAAGATGKGGLLRIDGNAAARCGISMKGIDIVVRGSVGHMSAFMAQAGTLIVFGDAGEALGDSIYEARLYVRGAVTSLGSDCIQKEMRDEHKQQIHAKLSAAGLAGEIDPSEFKRYGSGRTLYHFHVDNVSSY
ncbi:MAG: protein glxC [Candidatus Symbiobacter sp.]|nr:protein glxC [Candidatus Symbiobacter sp.]